MIQDLVEQLGYPRNIVVLDAETFYDADYTLSKLTTYEFVSDERFELLGWAVKEGNQPSVFTRELPEIDWAHTTILMHNAPFDALIIALKEGIYPPYIVDVLDLARHIDPRQSNKLADLCERHGLPAKGDTLQFLNKHQADFDRDMWLKLVEYATNDADRTYDLLGILLPKLSNPVFELEIARYTRNLFLKPVLCLDQDKAEKLKAEMVVEVQNVLANIDVTKKEIGGDKSFERLLREALGTEEPPMKMMKKGPMLAIAKTDEGYEYLLNHPDDTTRHLMEARVAVRSWPSHIKRVMKMQSTFEAAGQRLPVPLRYYGAHTGRWSGCEKINLQNLPAHGHPLICKIRELIEAPAGHTLVIADFAQIEARVLDWLAEQNDMLRAWADGRQIYCEFASKLVGHRVRKPKKTDSKAVAEWHGNYRRMGKIGILGAGFGMGKDRCLDYAKNTFGIDLTLAEAAQIIKLYRRTHAMVVLFWEKIERAFRMATQTGQTYELIYGLRFSREDNVTVIQLPSTRKLYYIGARVEGTARRPQLAMPNTGRTGGKTIYMWGGYLAENIVQAVSRDILAEAVLKIEELGVRIPLVVHDDMSTVVPETEAESYRDQIEAIALISPTWAPGLPLGIESKISKRYVK